MSDLQKQIAKKLKEEFLQIFPAAKKLTEQDLGAISNIASLEFKNSKLDSSVEKSYRLFLLIIYFLVKDSDSKIKQSKDSVLLYPEKEINSFLDYHSRTKGYKNDCLLLFGYQALDFFHFTESKKFKAKYNNLRLLDKFGKFKITDRLEQTVKIEV
jgi:hypothetical protein